MNVFYPVQWSIKEKKRRKKILAHKLLFPLCKNRGHFHHQLFKSGSDNNLSSAFFLLLYSCEKKQNRGKYFLSNKSFGACQSVDDSITKSWLKKDLTLQIHPHGFELSILDSVYKSFTYPIWLKIWQWVVSL